MNPLKLSELIQVEFSTNDYYREETKKNQIVLHHTVSGSEVNSSINWWKSDPRKVATSFIINGSGKIYQLFSSKYWAHHLGIKSDFLKNKGFKDYGTRNLILNKGSIGIEICNWGGLVKSENDTFHPALWDSKIKKFVPNKKVQIKEHNVETYDKPYRGFKYFEKYTNEQIESTARLSIYLCDKYNISKKYNSEMWDINMDALSGKSGIYTHTSFFIGKSDCHPQPELIEMLKSLD